jgi:hypothetical protein
VGIWGVAGPAKRSHARSHGHPGQRVPSLRTIVHDGQVEVDDEHSRVADAGCSPVTRTVARRFCDSRARSCVRISGCRKPAELAWTDVNPTGSRYARIAVKRLWSTSLPGMGASSPSMWATSSSRNEHFGFAPSFTFRASARVRMAGTDNSAEFESKRIMKCFVHAATGVPPKIESSERVEPSIRKAAIGHPTIASIELRCTSGRT